MPPRTERERRRHWSLRSVQVKLIKMGGRLVRHSRVLLFSHFRFLETGSILPRVRGCPRGKNQRLRACRNQQYNYLMNQSVVVIMSARLVVIDCFRS